MYLKVILKVGGSMNKANIAVLEDELAIAQMIEIILKKEILYQN